MSGTTQNELPTEDPSGELGPEAWAIYRQLWGRFWDFRASEAGGERFAKWHEAELKNIGDVTDLTGLAGVVGAQVSMIAEFTTSVALRAVAEYLAEREGEISRQGSDTPE